MLATVVLPVGERLGRPGLAARVVPQKRKTDEEQEPCQHARERQEAVEAIGHHAIPLVGGEPTLGRRPRAVVVTSTEMRLGASTGISQTVEARRYARTASTRR